MGQFEKKVRHTTEFAPHELECYTVTMANPLSPTASAVSRLILAGVVLGMMWLTVFWALA